MTRTLAELAEWLGADLEGNASVLVRGVAPIETAGPDQVTFLANPKYAEHLKTTRAAAVIVGRAQATAGDAAPPSGVALLRVDHAYDAFRRALTLFHPGPPHPQPGIDPSARVGANADVAEGVYVGPCCVVEDGARVGAHSVILAGSFIGRESVLGAECMIGPNATIMHGCTLGARVRIHPGTVVGSDGFGYSTVNGKHEKIPQVGGVTIGDDVEIGAGCTIDRAAMGQTTIGRGTKIDNLVQIAHNVQIGEDCIIVAQVGVSGSTKLGDRVTLAGQVGIVGHLEIGDGAVVAAQSGVGKSIPPGAIWLGTPAHEITHQRRVFAAVNSLPDTIRTIRELKERLAALEEKLK